MHGTNIVLITEKVYENIIDSRAISTKRILSTSSNFGENLESFLVFVKVMAKEK